MIFKRINSHFLFIPGLYFDFNLVPGRFQIVMSSPSATSTSRCRQNFSEACESAINAQINMEFCASYAYQAMAVHFAHDTVALPGLAAHFRKEAEEERSHALKFVDYVNKRGGVVRLTDIKAPSGAWKSAREALEFALSLEKDVNASLLALHTLADDNNDPHLADFIEEEFLDDQVQTLKELADLITQLDRCGNEGLGLYLFDQKLSS